MSGLAGYINGIGISLTQNCIKKMLSLINHRGPDFSDWKCIDDVTIGAASMSSGKSRTIIKQPLTNGDCSKVLALDGQIYNIDEMYTTLSMHGIRCNHSDIEVLFYSILTFGVSEIIPKINGMFSIVFYDATTKELWLARDKFGVKPLYYTKTTHAFVFASEIKALLAFPETSREINDINLINFLRTEEINRTRTLYRHIYAIEPGCIISIKNSQLIKKKYYDPRNLINGIHDSSHQDFNILAEELDNLLSTSIQARISRSSSSAIFCSGGIDSSLLSSYLSSSKLDLPMYVANVENAYPEHIKARLVAKRLQMPLKILQYTEDNFLRDWPQTIWHHDQPSIFRSDQAFFALANTARNDGVDNIFIGEGGDELFGGYRWYSAAGQIWEKQKQSSSKVNPIFNCVPTEYITLKSILRTYDKLPSVTRMFELRDQIIENDERVYQLHELITQFEEYESSYDAAFHARQFLDLYDRSSMLLQRADRMGMASSIECYVPFFDDRIVEFALSLPTKYMYSICKDKPLLRKLCAKYLPPLIAQGRKNGFAISSSVYRYALPLLKNGLLFTHLEIQNAYASRILSDLSQSKHNQYLLYQLVSLELWIRICIEAQDPTELGEQLLAYKTKELSL